MRLLRRPLSIQNVNTKIDHGSLLLSLQVFTWTLIVFLLGGCAVARVNPQASLKIRFLDEYIIPADFHVSSTLVGGLSDLDYDGEFFYTVCDLPSAPRIYRFSLDIKNSKIDTLQFLEVIPVDTESTQLVFDSEGVIYHPDEKRFTLSSEGSINRGRDPFVAELDRNGQVQELYDLPAYFLSSHASGPRNNSVFEGLCESVDGKGIWVANELPLKGDGPEPGIFEKHAPIRFTRLDRSTKKPERQFAYDLDRVRKIPLLPFGMNGVTAIEEYEEERFLVLERGFSAGYGRHGFRVLLYLADGREADSTLEVNRLKEVKPSTVTLANKSLLFDFNSIRKELTNRSVDNLEGMTFGPTLPNGNRTLVLIADNNFNTLMKQMNQVILMEVVGE